MTVPQRRAALKPGLYKHGDVSRRTPKTKKGAAVLRPRDALKRAPTQKEEVWSYSRAELLEPPSLLEPGL
jgi:hypothetical protein